MIRYVVVPGYVTSPEDGNRHFIGADRLIRLYGVNRGECILLERHLIEPGVIRMIERQHPEAIYLHPRHDGNYIVPEKNVEVGDGC